MRASFTLLMMLVFFCLNSWAQKKPEWVSQHPYNSDFYIGVGHANKKRNSDYQEDAKKLALSEISNSISVVVSEESLLHQMEANNTYDETFVSTLKTLSKNEIYGLEKFDEWQSKKEYWVYYKINKAEYLNLKKQKLKLAIEKGLSYFEKANEFEAKNNISQALYHYGEALIQLEYFLNEDLSVETKYGKKIQLGSEIFNKIDAIHKELVLNYFVPSTMKMGSFDKDYLELTAVRNNKPVKLIPLILFTDNDKWFNSPMNITTDQSGKASVEIPFNIRAFEKTSVGIGIDFESLLKTNIKHPELLNLFKQVKPIYTSFLIKTDMINNVNSNAKVLTEMSIPSTNNSFGSNSMFGTSSSIIGMEGFKSFDQMYQHLKAKKGFDFPKVVSIEHHDINFTISGSNLKDILALFEEDDSKIEALETLLDHTNNKEGLYEQLESSFKKKKHKKKLKSLLK